MRSFRDISMKHKLTAIIMLTSTIVLFLASGAFVTNTVVTFRRSMVEKLSALADVIGSNSTAALAFNDQESANETLSALEAEPHITLACIYTEDGKVFAEYRENHAAPNSVSPVLKEDEHYLSHIRGKPTGKIEDGHHFHDDHLDLFKRIILDGDTIGTLYLQSDLEGLYSRLWSHTVICAVVMLASIFVAYLLSSKFQRLITRQIFHLVQAMKSVSEEKNYSIQVKKQSNDELGILIDGFNEMLSQIHVRDQELEQHREHLEERVAMRTAELSKVNKHLEEAMHAAEAASRAKVDIKEPFDLILTDYEMPGMNGFDLAGKIRTTQALKTIPIIVLTSIGRIGDGKSCKDMGIEGYLTKPIRRDELRKVIESVLDLSTGEGVLTAPKLVTRHTIAEDYRKDVQVLLVEDYPTNQRVAMRHLYGGGIR